MKIVLIAASAFLGLASISASAMPIASVPEGPSMITQARNLCGVGYYRGGDGNCRPYHHHYHCWWSGGVKHCRHY